MIATVLAFFSFIYRGRMSSERSFIMVKPDGVKRGLIAEIIKRFERKGFTMVAGKLMKPDETLVKEHYIELKEMVFYPKLCKFICDGPVFAMAWEGQGIVKTAREMLGATHPADSKPGTIRGDFCINIGRNICHGSDSVESANKEIKLWFKDEELVSWKPAGYDFIYE